MAHPRFPLLELAYDDTHRAHMIADQNMPLRPDVLRAGFLPIARTVCMGLPPMDGALLTALVDRWRPETHTFHMPCGEMTVALEDMAMITALPLEGAAVTGMIQSEGWQDMRATHQDYLHMWEQRQRHNIAAGEDWFVGENQHYLLWFHRVARTRLRPTAVEYNMEDVDTDAEDDYDVDTRSGNQPECAPLHDHMLNCVTANPVDPARAPSGSAPGGSSAMARPSSSHRAGKAPASPQASDEDVPGDDSKDSPAPGFADQFIFSQHMNDAPPYTQTQGESSHMNMTQAQRESSQDSDGDAQPRRRCRRDRSDVPSSANRLQTGVRRQCRAENVFSPPDQRPPRR
ncbi:hypothetical protein HU200_058793 [Digitaria exilis]|uniref:Aminotransferase-like plant mobile domain-containing protein n=1 Tax=Digitaria exilis TaxID=1010633 RepID=A0A835AH80_9POAL|nr:hypothetical protein HU200_058793 [Digitaria exilis]